MKCPHCPYTTRFGKLNMDEHLKTAHDIGPQWDCNSLKDDGTPCTASFSVKKALTRHIETIHIRGKRYDCIACPKFGPRNDHLKTHMMTDHRCDIDSCAHTGTAEEVVAHRKKTHVMCFNCQLVFATNEAMAEHECWGFK